jgi:hypothetical protein
LYGFYGFDLTNNAKKKYTSENDPLQAQITMREFQFFESIIEKNCFYNNDEKTDMNDPHLWRAWKEFCRRCGCFEADGRHFEQLLH